MTKTALSLIVVLFLAPAASAQVQGGGQPEIDELTLADLLAVRAVTGARHDQRLVDSPRQISIVTAEDIRRRNYRSAPEAVADVLGVFVQQTNDGGGAPIIRGYIGNQILLLIDGIRLNTGAYRLGPNQYLNTIDINQIERIEVLRGAGSVLYGSDALGGVVNVITRSPDEEPGRPVTTRWFSRLSSANAGAVGRGEVSAKSGPVGVVGGVSLKRFGQLRGGRDTGVQPFSGYDEWDADAKLVYQVAPEHTLTFAGARVSQDDVQRADTLTAGTDLKMVWNPQARTSGWMRYSAAGLGAAIDTLNVTVGYQRQSERYAQIVAAAPTIERRHFDRTNSIVADVQLTSTLGPRNLLTYGVDATHDHVASVREDLSLTTGQRQAGRGVFADGSRYSTWSVYLQDEIDVSPRWHVDLGSRYSAFNPRATVSDPATGTIDIDSKPSAFTGSAHALFRLTPAIDLLGGVSQAFRAPNIDDLTILGAVGGRFELPNPGLEPERSLNLEASVRGRGLRGSGSATYFVSHIRDLIQREFGAYLGKPYGDFNGNDVRDSNEPLILQRQNAGRAKIHGVEFDGQVRIARHWTLQGMLVRTIGRDDITGEPLRRIPPTHGRMALAWNSGGRVWAEAYSMFASDQRRLAPGDLTDSRVPAGGTPGFVTVNARGSVEVSDALRITLGLENLTDRSYRTHGSGIERPGTNVVLGVSWVFQ